MIESCPELIHQYEHERDAEYERAKLAQGKPFISRYRPRRTQAVGEWRRAKLRCHSLAWSEVWWSERGFRLLVVAPEEDGFDLEPLAKLEE